MHFFGVSKAVCINCKKTTLFGDVSFPKKQCNEEEKRRWLKQWEDKQDNKKGWEGKPISYHASFSFPPKTEIMSIGTGNTIVEFFSGDDYFWLVTIAIIVNNNKEFDYESCGNLMISSWGFEDIWAARPLAIARLSSRLPWTQVLSSFTQIQKRFRSTSWIIENIP